MKINLKPISEQVAVVFGASSGIGRLTALEFARKGAKVCVAARSESGLKSLVEQIENEGGEAFYVVADAAEFGQVQNTADKTIEKYGRIDTWIHSAAVFIFAKVEDTTAEEYEQLMKVNLLGQIYGAKSALKYMKNTGGALIHITSVEAYRTTPYLSAYGSSKHGVYGFLKGLRVELAHEEVPVQVTQILPAAINTPIYEKGRNKMPYQPRPVPPVYHPQIVVDTVLYAAENPVRDIVAGGAGLGVVAAERISPDFANWMTRQVGFIGQKTDIPNPDFQAGNLFEPVENLDTIEGMFSDEQLKSDPLTWVSTHPKIKNTLFAAVGLLGGFLAYRALRNDNQQQQQQNRLPHNN